MEEIQGKIKELENKKAEFLAFCIESVGPQHGIPVTNALPGMSWHQWGEAVDCFWVVNGTAIWDTTTLVNGQNGYVVYADEAKKLGLDSGFYWVKIKDVPHVQLRSVSNPTQIYSIVEIDRIMKERFGKKISPKLIKR
jgi:hypothetical protein